MLVNSWPEAASTAVSQAAGCGMAALVTFVFLLRKRLGLAAGRSELQWGLAGAMLLCGPAIVLVMGARVDPIAVIMALSLTPVVTGVAESAFGSNDDGNLAGRMWPGLAAVSGFLLLVPQPSLSRVEVVAVLILAPLLTGVGAAMFHRKDENSNRSLWKVASLSGAALLFGVGILVNRFRGGESSISGLAAIVDGVTAWLAVTALERIGATRWTAQFALVPLTIFVEGILLTGLVVHARSVTGLGLLLLAGIFLLVPSGEEAV